MTKRFLAMIPFLWKWEGTKYENDPDDPGGATKYGIDKRSHPDVDIRNLTEKQAIQIYWDEYWNANRCERFPYPLGEVYFNACVNTGAGRAEKLLAASRSASEFLDEQDAFYRRLADARPRSRKFLRGWLNRTADLRKFLKIQQ